MNIKELVKDAHENAKAKGWHDEDRTFGELIALCHAELSEALEEYRNGRGLGEIYYVGYDMSDNKVEKDHKFEGVYGLCKPEGIPIELADVVIRIADMFGKNGTDITLVTRHTFYREFDTFGDFISLCHLHLSMAYEYNSYKSLKGLITVIEKFCSGAEIDLDEATRIKMEYNKGRSHKHGGKVL